MKFSYFEPTGYKEPDAPTGWPAAPKHFDRRLGPAAMEQALELIELACEVGFDSITVAEHHYGTRQLCPDPLVMAAAVSQRVPGVSMTVMGTDLPLHNPVAVAERYAMLDNLLGGRLYVGLFRGTPNEYITFGTNPAQSRAMFEEGVRLVKRAWTEPEPFGWEGTHYRYRTIATWPQPTQTPHPRLLTSAGSAESAVFAAREHLDIGFFAMPLDVANKIADVYRDEARRCGWEPTPDNILYRTLMYVADTDAEAISTCNDAGYGSFMGRRGPEDQAANDARAQIGAVLTGGWAGSNLGELIRQFASTDHLPPFVGAPDTVAQQIRDAESILGFGRMDLVCSGDGLSQEASRHCIELFGKEVIPQFTGAEAVV